MTPETKKKALFYGPKKQTVRCLEQVSQLGRLSWQIQISARRNGRGASEQEAIMVALRSGHRAGN